MNTFEKIYSIFAILFAVCLLVLLCKLPELRQLKVLLPLSGAGLLVNVGLMFITFRDVFFRRFKKDWHKFLWAAILLFFWPSILLYLPLHGFRRRL